MLGSFGRAYLEYSSNFDLLSRLGIETVYTSGGRNRKETGVNCRSWQDPFRAGCSKSSPFRDIIWLESLKPFVFLFFYRYGVVPYTYEIHILHLYGNSLHNTWEDGGGGGRPPSTVLQLTIQYCTRAADWGCYLSPPLPDSENRGWLPFPLRAGGAPTGGRQQKRPPPPSLALAVEIKKRACWLAAGEIGILSSIFLLLLRAFLCLSRIRGKEVGKYEFSVSRSVHTVC